MKRSQINLSHRQASACFARHHWALPPRAAWDITDFGLGDLVEDEPAAIRLVSEPRRTP